MKKHEQISETTKNNFISSFWELYKTNDFSKITVAKICKLANYDRTTFYRYFLNISDILSQFEDYVIDNLKNDIQNNSVRMPNLAFDNFKIFNDKYGEYIVGFHEKFNRSFYIKFKNLIKNYVFDYLNLKIHDDEKKEFLFEFLFSSLIISYAYWYHNQQMMSLESFAKLANNMIIHGGKIIIDNVN